MEFSNLNRTEWIHRLKNEVFDVVVVGGGITGAGIALDATSRGMKTALIEMQDFSSGTSSRSTKLVHGGLRYLKQLEVKMVAEVGKERSIVYENGPHVTKPEWMLLPLHKGGTFGKISTSIGLRVYDFLAGVKKSERRSILNAKETQAKEPLIKKSGLKGAGYYVEYRTDDARLTIEVIKKAVELGTTALNYSKMINLIYENGKTCGLKVEDQITGEEYDIYAKKVVNATGPWVDQLREMDRSKKDKTLKLTKGVHIVIDQAYFPLKQATYFDTPDGRMIFAIPRDGKTYVGTTDTFYSQDPVNPCMTYGDRDYILKAIQYMFPKIKLSEKVVESSWAGVRPLIYEEGKDPSEISRKDEIWESESGLITIAGGKLTGYRKMAETVVDLLAMRFVDEERRSFAKCQTKNLPISGGDVGGSANFKQYVHDQVAKGIAAGLAKVDAYQLASIYGSNASIVFKLLERYEWEAVRSGIPLALFAQLLYGIHYEMVATPMDFFHRRTGALLFNIQSVVEWKNKIIQCMSIKFNWTEAQKQNYTLGLEQAIIDAMSPALE
jgi:glycerol-3-phosphate dehydrogenase